MTQQTKYYPARGGLDLITPAIEKDPGGLIATNNYECNAGGYGRVDGYERIDGRTKPSAASYWYLNFDAGTAAISEGDTVTGATSAATGLAIIDAVIETGSYVGNDAVGYLILMNVSGTFQNNENLQVSAATKSVSNGLAVERGADNDTQDTTWLRDAMETARTAIGTVTGSGNMRGAATLGGVRFAFRDNAGATAKDIYKSTASGWTKVALGFKIPFTSGGVTEIVVGQTITGATGAATAVLTGVSLQSGSWAGGDAAGDFIMLTATGTFQSENINVGANPNLATIAADKVAITLAAGGRVQCRQHNFGGHAGTNRLYGCDGVSLGFEFDGTTLVPIPTGMTTDTPIRVMAHKQHLFFAFTGGSLQNSGLGLPYAWTVITGAAEMALGEEITDISSDIEGFAVIGGRNKISILNGQDVTNWELVPWSDGSGVIPWTMQRLGKIMFMDDIGVRNLSQARDYGNFSLGALSKKIEPLFRAKRKAGVTVLSTIVSKRKDMLRIFFSDKTGISIYLGRGPNKPEPATFTLPVTVECTFVGKNSTGDEELLFGSTDGYMYELDVGANNDGAEVVAYARFPFNHVGSPTREKQWFKATLEMDAKPQVSFSTTAEYSYASDDQPPSSEVAFTVTGGGGFWEEDNWDDFNWSAPVEGLAEAHLDGQGTNVSVAALSAGTYDDPHTIHGLTLHYSMRRLVA